MSKLCRDEWPIKHGQLALLSAAILKMDKNNKTLPCSKLIRKYLLSVLLRVGKIGMYNIFEKINECPSWLGLSRTRRCASFFVT